MLAIMMGLTLQASERPAYVTDDGWTYRGASGAYASMLFTRQGPTPKTVWVRYEFKANSHPTRSLRHLEEANCETGQSRVVQQTDFLSPNLTGQSQETLTPRPWSYPAPGTFGEVVYTAICSPWDLDPIVPTAD